MELVIDTASTPIVDQNNSGSGAPPSLPSEPPVLPTLETEQSEDEGWTSEDIKYIGMSALSQRKPIARRKNSKPAPTFPFFSKLPTEVRLMIWHEVISSPRMVRLDFLFADEDFRFGSPVKSCSTRTPPPVLLSVCHESRIAALEKYRLCFGTNFTTSKIYFNPEVDILHMLCCDMDTLTALSASDTLNSRPFRGNVRHMALAMCPNSGHLSSTDISFYKADLQQLETMTMIYLENCHQHVHWQDVDLEELEIGKEMRMFKACPTDEEFFRICGRTVVPPVIKFKKPRRAREPQE